MTAFFLEHGGTVTMLAFILWFLGVAVYVMLPSKKAELEKHAHIPLQGD